LTEDNLLKDSDLSGNWTLELPDKDDKGGEGGRIPLELTEYGTSTYDLVFPEELFEDQGKNKTSEPEWPRTWTLQIGKIDDQLYGQVIPQELPSGPPVAFGIPIYWFGRVSLEKDIIKFYPLLNTQSANLAEREKLQHMSYEPSSFVELTIFTMSTAELQKMVTEHGEEIFSPKPMILRRDADDSDRPKLIHKLENRAGSQLQGIRYVTFNPDGTRLAICGDDLRVKVWKNSNYKLVLDVREETRTIDFDPTGSTFASGVGNDLSIRNTKTGETERLFSLRSGVAGIPLRVKYSPDGTMLAAQDSHKGVRVYDIDKGNTRFHIKDAESLLFSFHPTMRDLAVVASEWNDAESRRKHRIKRYDSKSGERSNSPDCDVSLLRNLNDMEFSPDGKQIAVCGSGAYSKKGLCLIFDTDSGQILQQLQGTHDPIRCVRFHKDGKRVVTGSEGGSIVLWCASTGATLNTFCGHTGPVNSVAFHPDGRTLASGSQDGTIRLWDISTGNKADGEE
jgi:hypothetical protein